MRDRAQLFINGQHVHTVYNCNLSPFTIAVTLQHYQNPSAPSAFLLELAVENMGRASCGVLDDQRKGFEGTVALDAEIVDTSWEHFSIDFSAAFLTAVKHSRDWVPTVRPSPGFQGRPSLYRGYFKVRRSRDTFIDMSRWTKGVVVLNGLVLGRYWNVGPQQSLYVPSPILNVRGTNEIIVFELERTVNAKVKFVGKSSWGSSNIRMHKHRSNG